MRCAAAPYWGDYRSDHRYEVEFIGLGERMNVQFHDTDCANNTGVLDLVVLGPPGWPPLLLHHEG